MRFLMRVRSLKSEVDPKHWTEEIDSLSGEPGLAAWIE